MKPLPGQKELPLVIDHKKTVYDSVESFDSGDLFKMAHKGKHLAKLFLKYDDKPTSEMWIEILRLSRELVK
ncbi:MAG: hypothetical protein J6A65_18170 [Pseudomonas sp.]|nr:hypothetical protein [Pseudomonas sp.]